MSTLKGQSFVVNTQREFLFMERIVITGALGQILYYNKTNLREPEVHLKDNHSW